MNKFYSILTAASIMAVCASGISFASGDSEVVTPSPNDWVSFAATGNSGAGFSKSTSHAPSGASYSYSVWNTTGTMQKNLWLSTPFMELKAGTTYRLDMQYQTWSNFKVENLEIYLSDIQVDSNEAASGFDTVEPVYITSAPLTGNSNTWLPLTVENLTADADRKCLVFHISGECSGRFSVADVKLTECSPSLQKPLAPADLTAAAHEDKIAVDLSWTLPAENTSGTTLTAVYDLSGRLAATDTASLPKGVYIVRTAGGISHKCIIR